MLKRMPALLNFSVYEVNPSLSILELGFPRGGAHFIVPAVGNLFDFDLSDPFVMTRPFTTYDQSGSVNYRCSICVARGSCT